MPGTVSSSFVKFDDKDYRPWPEPVVKKSRRITNMSLRQQRNSVQPPTSKIPYDQRISAIAQSRLSEIMVYNENNGHYRLLDNTANKRADKNLKK